MVREEGSVSSHEAGSTRDLILDVAERRFAEHGFSGVAMREIAADVGLKNQASLYHHFRNKRALYEAVMERGLDPIVAMVAEAVSAGKTGPDVLDAAVDRLLDYLAEHPNLPRLIQRGLDDSRYLRTAIPKLLIPLSERSMIWLLETGGPWTAEDLGYIVVGFYHLIVGYFANTALVEMAMQADPFTPAAVARQRRFLKLAFARVLGVGADEKPKSESRALG
ncbi:MAG: TetR family transcriptional regulator [Candidatus Binatia bacterium]